MVGEHDGVAVDVPPRPGGAVDDAKLRGLAGVIVEGPTRDVDEAREYDFPEHGIKFRTPAGWQDSTATAKVGDAEGVITLVSLDLSSANLPKPLAP